jgi:hypothetical protein
VSSPVSWEYCALSHLRRAIFPLLPSKNIWLLMAKEYTVYFDDGGHPDDQPVVLVAGFISTADQWELFNSAWRDFLKRYGISCGFLHMTTLRARQSEYKEWSDTKFNHFLNEAAMWIQIRARMSFCVLVPMEDYARVNQEYALQECLGAPYAFAARFVMDKVADWAKTYNKENHPILTVFESGSKHKGDLISIFERDGFRDPAFAKKEDVPALQPCDWLAWESFAWFKKGAHEKGVSPNSWFGKLLKVPYEHYIWTISALRHECEAGDVPKRTRMDDNTRILFESEKKRPRRRTIYALSKSYPNYAGRFDEANQKRIQQLRQDNDGVTENSTQRDQGKTGSGEGD